MGVVDRKSSRGHGVDRKLSGWGEWTRKLDRTRGRVSVKVSMRVVRKLSGEVASTSRSGQAYSTGQDYTDGFCKGFYEGGQENCQGR